MKRDTPLCRAKRVERLTGLPTDFGRGLGCKAFFLVFIRKRNKRMANAAELDQGVGEARKILSKQQTDETSRAVQCATQPQNPETNRVQTGFTDRVCAHLFPSIIEGGTQRGQSWLEWPNICTVSVGTTGTKSQSGCQSSFCSLSLVFVSFAANSNVEPLFLQSNQTHTELQCRCCEPYQHLQEHQTRTVSSPKITAKIWARTGLDRARRRGGEERRMDMFPAQI